jgi:catechol 2,3-dioxygenase-like lactoylglutathione lyase family enzyme
MSSRETLTPGIHHVTAIAGDPQRNVDFYAGTLGMRMVKRTVNFDDPHSYHFYYGDEHGTPGTLLTFFPWPGARSGRAGPGQVAVTSLSVPQESLGWWIERLATQGVPFERPGKRFGLTTVSLRDPDGMVLELVADPAAGARAGWEGGTVPAEHAVRGVHGVTLWVNGAEGTARMLTETLGFGHLGDEGSTSRFAAEGGADRFAALVDVRDVGGFPAGTSGAGTVHHVAWRTADDEAELALRQRVIEAGAHPTPVIDRSYFHSVYFREPGGVLFEIATDLPGFATDEPAESLGERLMLPPQYEPQRARIEAVLHPIHLPRAAAREGV